jgi:hypothetical protein
MTKYLSRESFSSGGNSKDYREGWDKVFGKSKRRKKALTVFYWFLSVLFAFIVFLTLRFFF